MLALSIASIAFTLAAQTPTDATKVDRAKPQEAAAAPVPVPATGATQTAQATLGLLLNDGNVSSVAGRAGGNYQLRFDVHGLGLEAGAGIASIAQDPDLDPANGYGVPLGDPANKLNTTFFTRLRYDFFLSPDDSLYASGFVFHDSAANLIARLRADLGYRHFLFQVPKHSFAAEVGVVYTIDNTPLGEDTNNDGVVDINDAAGFETSGGTYGARLAVAYTNALSDNVQYATTAEVVPNLFPDVEAPFEIARNGGAGDGVLKLGEATIFTWVNTLTFNINEQLNIGLSLNVVYDNGAIARRNAYTNHDAALSFQLGYKLF
jgi:hypothetical protein